MTELGLALQTAAAVVGALGVAWAVAKNHTHPDLVTRAELSLLRSQLNEIQRELRDVRRLLLERYS